MVCFVESVALDIVECVSLSGNQGICLLVLSVYLGKKIANENDMELCLTCLPRQGLVIIRHEGPNIIV